MKKGLYSLILSKKKELTEEENKLKAKVLKLPAKLIIDYLD